jgi:hypothetical protein
VGAGSVVGKSSALSAELRGLGAKTPASTSLQRGSSSTTGAGTGRDEGPRFMRFCAVLSGECRFLIARRSHAPVMRFGGAACVQ